MKEKKTTATKKKSSNIIHTDMADYRIKIYNVCACLSLCVCYILVHVSDNFSMTLVHSFNTVIVSNCCFSHKISTFSFHYEKNIDFPFKEKKNMKKKQYQPSVIFVYLVKLTKPMSTL